MAVINGVLFSKDLGGLGYMSQFLPTQSALLLMSACKNPYNQFKKDIKDHIRFSNTMKVLFDARYDKLPKIKKECSTFDRALSVWKTSDQNLFTSNIMNWKMFCQVDQLGNLDKKAKKALIEEIKNMTSSELSELNLSTVNFLNISELNQTDGNGDESDEELFENDVEPQLSVLRDSTSGFGVIRYVAGNQYAGFINEKGLPDGNGTVIIYDPVKPQVTLHQTEGQWENGELKIESQIFRVETKLDMPGIFVGIEEGNTLNGIFYKPNGESPNTEIDNQGNFTFSYS